MFQKRLSKHEEMEKSQMQTDSILMYCELILDAQRTTNSANFVLIILSLCI